MHFANPVGVIAVAKRMRAVNSIVTNAKSWRNAYRIYLLQTLVQITSRTLVQIGEK